MHSRIHTRKRRVQAEKSDLTYDKSGLKQNQYQL